MFTLKLPIIVFLVGIFYFSPVQTQVNFLDLPGEVVGCVNKLNDAYAADPGSMPYQTFLDRYRACYIDNGYKDLLPANMREQVKAASAADCLLVAQRDNEGSLPQFKRAARACYEQYSTGGIWDTPELKKLMLEQFDGLTVLDANQAQLLEGCLENVKMSGGPNAESQRGIAACFEKVGITSTARLYGGVATTIDCAEEISKVKGNLLNTTLVSSEQKSALEKCVATRLAPVTVGLSVAAIPLVAGWRNVFAFGYLVFTQFFLLFRKKPPMVGKVFDSTTHEPVDLSIVRLMEGDKVVKTSVTDKSGEYFFLPALGKYTLDVVKPNFIFPSVLGGSFSKTSHYFGGELKIVTDSEVVAKHVPLDPAEAPANPRLYLWNKWRDVLLTVVSFVGPLFSIVAAVVLPSLITVVIAVVHSATLVIFWRLTTRPKKQFGMVKDFSGKTLSGVAVSLMETKYNRRIHYTLTDLFGRYYIPAVVGSYLLVFSKPGMVTKTVTLQVGEKEKAAGEQHQVVQLELMK